MMKILFTFLAIIFCGAPHLGADPNYEENYQLLERSLHALDPSLQLNKDKDCLSADELYQAARATLPQIETLIINALANPQRNKNLIEPYLKLWVLGQLGSDFFDLALSNHDDQNFVEIEKHMFLVGVPTHLEGSKTYWVPFLIDIESKRFSLLGWEHCHGKCYTDQTVWDTAHGICGVWTWDPQNKTVTSFCHCGNPENCGTKNIYRIEAGNLMLVKSLRKTKWNNSSFSRYAKPCCVR